MLFFTYFDSNYLTRGKACYYTLMKYEGAHLVILALDDYTFNILKTWNNTTVIQLKDLETFQPKLLDIKKHYKIKEYYASLTPILPQYIMNLFPNEKVIWYTDADMIFFHSPFEMISELNDKSILITPHENINANQAGVFNVGILGYKNDEYCNNFLNWWENKCLEWCKWETTDDGRFADQGYLNIFNKLPSKYNEKISTHQGINMGPWNICLHTINKNLILENNKKLICYHFHGFKRNEDSYINDTGWKITSEQYKLIYKPYNELLKLIEKGVL